MWIRPSVDQTYVVSNWKFNSPINLDKVATLNVAKGSEENWFRINFVLEGKDLSWDYNFEDARNKDYQMIMDILFPVVPSVVETPKKETKNV